MGIATDEMLEAVGKSRSAQTSLRFISLFESEDISGPTCEALVTAAPLLEYLSVEETEVDEELFSIVLWDAKIQWETKRNKRHFIVFGVTSTNVAPLENSGLYSLRSVGKKKQKTLHRFWGQSGYFET